MNTINRIVRDRIVKSLAFVMILTVGLVVLMQVKNLLLSTVLAFVVSYLLAPIIAAMERSGMPRKTAVMFLFAAIGLLIIVAAYLLLPVVSNQIFMLNNEMPMLIEGTTTLFARLQRQLNTVLSGYGLVDLGLHVITYFSALPKQIFSQLPNFVTASLSTLVIAPLLTFFMLLEGRMVVRRLFALVPNNMFELALNLQYQINRQLSDFIRARLLEATIVGVVVWTGLALISFPYAILLGVFAGLTNLIPYIGPLIGAVPAVLIALVAYGDGVTILLVSVVYVGAQLIDNMIVIPFIVAKIVNLHPIIVVVVILIGAQSAGILGMIISIPVACIIKLTAEALYHHLLEFRV